MGFFGKLFGGGGGARKPPSWASAFGDDGERFDRFAAVVAEVLTAAGYPLDGGDVRSGSVMIEDDSGASREWIFHAAATRCADADESEWPAIVAGDFTGEGYRRARRPVASGKQWIMASSAWGGTLLECGAKEMMMVLLPIRDRAPLASLPAFPRGLIHAIVVCNASGQGVLDASAVAKACGLDRVYAIDAAKPVGGGVSVVAMPAELRRGPLRLSRSGASVLGRWDDGITAMIGEAIPMSALLEVAPHNVLGMIVMDDFDTSRFVDFALSPPKIVIIANVPGHDARRLAKVFTTMGIGCQVANLELVPPEEEAPPAQPRRLQVFAHMMSGALDRADAIAADGIAAGEDADDLRYQRAVIAMMRGDDAAALAQLAPLTTAEARNSRALLFARAKDPRAIAEARAALTALPTDAIAIRGAVLAHAILGDRDGARAILDAHGKSLGADVRAGLDRAIDDPSPLAQGPHRFPGHAQLALDTVKPMLDERRFADAEPVLRRAAAWDPDNLGLIAELGFALAQQGKDADAIAIYDESIARGGANVLLRFNRGNCRLRTQAYAAAVDDFRACVEVKPDWHEARINLCSALFAAGDKPAATSQITELKQMGGPPQHIRTLEQMVAGTL